MKQTTYDDPIQLSPIAIPSDFNSAVDIIIPYHGEYQKLTTLLDSIFRLIRSNYYKVCIVDDASPNASFIEIIKQNAAKNAAKRKGENVVQTIRLKEQCGFAGALKAGFEATSNPYVCFINSDCKIEDVNWLRGMGECLMATKHLGVRMVAPMTDNAVGGHPAQQCSKEDRFNRPYNPVSAEGSDFSVINSDHIILKKDDYLSMYCFMCERGLFQECGGFIKEYPYGYYEDEEFAARMQHRGFKQAVSQNSWVHHDGQLTIKRIWRENPKVKDIMEVENRERCIADMKKLI